MRHTLTVLLVLFVAAGAAAAADTCAATSKSEFDWIRCRMRLKAKNAAKQSDTTKQSQTPSAADNAASLLDRSSATDLAGAAIGLLGVGGNNGATTAGGTGDTSVTASGYALYTSFTGQNPFDADTYDKGNNWRRLSFTIGEETPQNQTDPNEGKNRIFGSKFLIVNQRDVSSGASKKKIGDWLTSLTFDEIKAAIPRVSATLQSFLHTDENGVSDAFAAQAVNLTDDQLAEIDKLLPSDAFNAIVQSQADEVQSLLNQWQVSIAYTAKLSEGTGSDLHRGEFIVEKGIGKSGASFNLNASFDYTNSPKLGGDTRAARIAGELDYSLNPVDAVKNASQPWVVALSGEADWSNSYDAIYKVQGRVEIPIAKGLTLPISVTHANSTTLIKEAETKGQFGLTIDFSKLAGLLKP